MNRIHTNWTDRSFCTGGTQRGVVREEANIILTNPDMLHASVLPGHKRFRRVLANLSHVVIDEVCTYI